MTAAKLLALLSLLACSSAPLPPPPCLETIYGARIEPQQCGIPVLQVWAREVVIFDDAAGTPLACDYTMWPTDYTPCALVGEALIACPLSDGYSAAVYDVALSYETSTFTWRAVIRLPTGGYMCDQNGGGALTVVK